MTTAADFRPVIDRLVEEACASASLDRAAQVVPLSCPRRGAGGEVPAAPGDALPVDLHARVIGITRKTLVELILQHTRCNRTEAAEILGISPWTLTLWIREHGIEIDVVKRRASYFTSEPPAYPRDAHTVTP